MPFWAALAGPPDVCAWDPRVGLIVVKDLKDFLLLGFSVCWLLSFLALLVFVVIFLLFVSVTAGRFAFGLLSRSSFDFVLRGGAFFVG